MKGKKVPRNHFIPDFIPHLQNFPQNCGGCEQLGNHNLFKDTLGKKAHTGCAVHHFDRNHC